MSRKIELTEEQEKIILEKYANYTPASTIQKEMGLSEKKVKFVLVKYGIKRRKSGKFNRLTEEQEKEIVRLYIEEKWDTNSVARKFKFTDKRLKGILAKYGHKKRAANDTSRLIQTKEQEDEILSKLDIGLKIKEISTTLSFYCPTEVIAKFIKKKFPAKTRSFKELMAMRYSPENAVKLTLERSQRMSRLMTGENSPNWQRPPIKTHSSGINGWYKGDIHFRSLKELGYILQLEETNADWESGERKRFFIEYTDIDGRRKNYWPDFILNGTKIVEIKPKALQANLHILAKANAAMEFCAQKGWTYEMVDFQADLKKIKSAFDKKLIDFAKNCEERFLKYYAKKNPISPSSS